MALTIDSFISFATTLNQANRSGKSYLLKVLKQRPKLDATITGTFVLDEYDPAALSEFFSLAPTRMPALGPEFSYKTEAFPAATVDIYEVAGSKHDPRNPNPNSGRRRFFIIKVGERQVGGEYANLTFAKAAAAPMHKRLVDALIADIKKENPNFGRF